MVEALIAGFQGFSPEWALFFISMFPISELQLSIPLGIEYYHLSLVETTLFALFGNMVPALFLLAFFPLLHDWLRKQPFIGRKVQKSMERAERAFSTDYAKYGALALIAFVALPFPFTGVWTGSLAAFIFNIPFRKSFPLLFIGDVIAAIVVVVLTVGVAGMVRFFL